MTHRQPKFSQVLVCEIGKDAKIDIVLSKALGVLGHAELFEPVRYFLCWLAHDDNSDVAPPRRAATYLRVALLEGVNRWFFIRHRLPPVGLLLITILL